MLQRLPLRSALKLSNDSPQIDGTELPDRRDREVRYFRGAPGGLKPRKSLLYPHRQTTLGFGGSDIVIQPVSNHQYAFRGTSRLRDGRLEYPRIGLGKAEFGGCENQKKMVPNAPIREPVLRTFGLVGDDAESGFPRKRLKNLRDTGIQYFPFFRVSHSTRNGAALFLRQIEPRQHGAKRTLGEIRRGMLAHPHEFIDPISHAELTDMVAHVH